MIEPNDTTRRVIGGLWLAVFVGCAANYYLRLHVFGRFDKLALVLCIGSAFAVAYCIRPSVPKKRPTFSWLAFAATAGWIVGACGLIGGLGYLGGEFDGLESLAFLVLPATLVLFLAHRWRLLRRELSDGTFSDERYRADPGNYVMGPSGQRRLGILLVVALVLALSLMQTFSAHPT